MGAESAFARVAATLGDILGVEQPVDSLEGNNRHMGAAVGTFRDARPVPAPSDEGAVFVASADGKGISMRRGPVIRSPRPGGARAIKRTTGLLRD
ncbi:hypothetical protein GobsT_33650 [Gemmata obscuriglobus]